MRCPFTVLPIAASVGLAVLLGATAEAQRININDNHRRSMGNKRPPELFGNLNKSSGHRGGASHGGHHDGHVKHRHRYRHYYPHSGYRMYYGGAYRYPYGYGYPYDYGYGYPYTYPNAYWYSRYQYAPIHIPAEQLYGPQALKRFMGVDQPSGGQQPSQPIAIEQGGDNHRADEGNPMAGGPFNDGDGPAGGGRAANLAWRYIGFGDAQFSAGEFLEANTRYRKAVAAAPELADPHFRQGYALMAAGRWRLAADAIRRGLKLDPDWPRSGFSNAELYAGHPEMKTEHLEKLAEAAEAEQQDVDRLFLLGVVLHFDGRPDRARPFFERAQQLTGGNDPAVVAFLVGG